MTHIYYVLFFLSGAAALIYETVWPRYLSLILGHDAYAQTLVLAVFMGGLALGALITGGLSKRLAHPLRAFAAVELISGLINLVFHLAFQWVADQLAPALAGAPQILSWLTATALILPQSILLGATYPLLAAGLLRRNSHMGAGGVLAALYFFNSIGGALGVPLTGFLLIPAYGLPGAVFCAAALNLLVGAAAWLCAGKPQPIPPPGYRSGIHINEVELPAGAHRVLLLLAFGTAAASFVYEIAWIRMLTLLLGSTTHSFELMISAFILGLAIGGLAIRSRIDRLHNPLLTLILIQIIMGVAALITLPVYLQSFQLIGWLEGVYRASVQDYVGYNLVRYGACMAVMLPATICAGMVLPLLVKLLYQTKEGESLIGRAYGFNTLGGILGVLTGGLVLLPLLGLKLLLCVGAGLDICLGLLVGRRLLDADHKKVMIRYGAVAGVLFVILALAPLNRHTLISGVFMDGVVEPGEILSYHDGRTATVAVQTKKTGPVEYMVLSTNGKPDASRITVPPEGLPRPFLADESTQYLAAVLPILHKPDAVNAAVIGLGSGITSHQLLAAPQLESLITLEIEPAIVDAASHFMPANQLALTDPRSTILTADARSWFSGDTGPFDVIVSEPSNPWVSGVAGLFTVEFYEKAAATLTENGIFAQWIHLYDLDDDLVLSVTRALEQTFPHHLIYQIGGRDTLIIASRTPLAAPDWDVLPAMSSGLDDFHALTPQALTALQLIDSRLTGPLAVDVRPNTDFYPILDNQAEKARYLGRDATGFLELFTDGLDIVSPLMNRRIHFQDNPPFMTGAVRLNMLLSGSGTRNLIQNRNLEIVAEQDRVRAGDLLKYLEALDSAELPPDGWKRFVDNIYGIFSSIHLGSSGVVDPTLFQSAARYARIQNAPPEVHISLEFMKAYAAWDFATVETTSQQLLQAKDKSGDVWLVDDVLRDGGVIARIMLNDPAAAMSFYQAFPPAPGFRARFLEAVMASPPVFDRENGAKDPDAVLDSSN